MDNFVKMSCGTMTDAQIAEELTENTGIKITKIAVKRRRQGMGLTRKKGDLKGLVKQEKGLSYDIGRGVRRNV